MAGLVNHDKFYETVVSKRADESCKCWWPTWAEDGALKNTERVRAADRSVDITKWNEASRTFTVETGGPMDARVATFYYPYWKASVNGTPVDIRKDEFGAILIPIPEVSSVVDLNFDEPPVYSVAFFISLISFSAFVISIAVVCFVGFAGRSRREAQ
jgi:hypothetical protein